MRSALRHAQAHASEPTGWAAGRRWQPLAACRRAVLRALPAVPGGGLAAAAEAGSLAGMGLLLVSVFVFDKTTPFPSLYAMTPTLGTALIILFAVPGTAVGNLLASRALVGIGLVSYSAYLWHQPLFAFARHASHQKCISCHQQQLPLAAMGLAQSRQFTMDREV